MTCEKRLKVLVGFLFLLVLFDELKFSIFGGTTIVNWRSFIHPFWVILGFILYFIGTKLSNCRYWNSLFFLYSLVFLASLLNQYFNFTPVLTYNCMLFNLFFVGIYIFLGANKKSGESEYNPCSEK